MNSLETIEADQLAEPSDVGKNDTMVFGIRDGASSTLNNFSSLGASQRKIE